MKRAILLLGSLMSAAGLSACAADNLNASDPSAPDRPEKIYEDVAAEDFRQINISGRASSIVIQRSESDDLEFYNGDLNPAHTYTVRCDKEGETLNIELVMENPENDNDVLGSPMICIPQKEFDQIEVAGKRPADAAPALCPFVLFFQPGKDGGFLRPAFFIEPADPVNLLPIRQ